MIPAIYASAMMRRGGGIACGVETEYAGGEAFPSEFSVTLGSGLGAVFLEYATGGLPDKIEVWVSGAKVLDTGYVGDVSNQAALDSALADLGLPPEPIRQRAGASALVADDFSDVKTREYAAYYKSTTSAQATVRVYAPLSGTAWRIKLNCPDGYYYQIFDESGAFVVPSHVTAVDALLVAGGGGGGIGLIGNFQPRGGGGAGGVLVAPGLSVTPGASVPVRVGAGGVGGNDTLDIIPTSGENSEFLTEAAVGGGGAGFREVLPEDGGSGGGGNRDAPNGVGIPGQGNNGGQGTIATSPYSTGGGGGSKTAGATGSSVPGSGRGGDGHALGELGWGGAIAFGAPKAVAGGGGGGIRSVGARSANPGGFGGGGDSGLIGGTGAQKSGQSGINGTGAGGGGPANSDSAPAANGGDGGSGLVIIRYPAIPGL